MYKIHICICKYTPGLSRCIFTRRCIFAHVQINFYIYAIAFTCPKIHPGANYTYMYNIHPVCKSAHVNGALYSLLTWTLACVKKWFIFMNVLLLIPYFIVVFNKNYNISTVNLKQFFTHIGWPLPFQRTTVSLSRPFVIQCFATSVFL